MRNKIDAPCRPVACIGCRRTEMLAMQIQLLRAALRDRSGVSTMEYGVLAVGIILAIGAAISTFTGALSAGFTQLALLVTAAF
jgi:Flp pilus assembly pilin Flp